MCPPSESVVAAPQPLDSIRVGDEVTIRSLETSQHSTRLRELGIGEGQTVKVLSTQNPMICKVGECRIGLCRCLAHCIYVVALAAPDV